MERISGRVTMYRLGRSIMLKIPTIGEPCCAANVTALLNDV